MARRTVAGGVGSLLITLVASLPASAQPVADVAADTFRALDLSAAPGDPQSGPGVVSKLVRDIGGDYIHFVSKETAIWLGAGGGAALAVHQADQSIADWVQTNSPSLPGGSIYGSQLAQIPVAVVWWIAGSAAGSTSQAETGRDLLRAQVSVFSWTYGIKFIANRTRPNGDPRSFPSGHASTSFTTAMVLQEHFGWKVGIPAFAAAAYTGMSRIADNQHWTSDVVFGAALGMASGRTVTLHLRNAAVSVAPVPLPGGVGVLATVLR